jgi:hypothetical protein
LVVVRAHCGVGVEEAAVAEEAEEEEEGGTRVN